MTRLVGFVFLVISSITNLYAKLPSGSPLVAQSGVSVLIENIKPTNRIISFDPETGSFPLASVQAVHATTVSEVYHFTTSAGMVVAGPNQPFFDLVRKQFVPAYAWTTEHVFVDQQMRPVQTIGIKCVQGSQQCYELYLQPHHIFFVSDARVMAHNNPLAIYTAIRCASIVAQALPEIISGFMAVQKLYDAGRAKFLASPAVAVPLPPPASIVPVSVPSIAPVTKAQSSLLPQKIISAAVKKTAIKPQPTVMSSTSSIVHIPIKYVVQDAQAVGTVQAVEKVATVSSAGTQVASAVVPPVYPIKEALMQAALPVALAGAAIAYGLHCQDARDQSMAVCERQQEIVRYAGVSADGHVQRVTKEALLAGLIVDSNHYFGRFDAYRFSEYLEFLKTDGEYERYIQILRDLLEKKADSLSDQEYALVSQVPGIKKPNGWLGTVKKWFTPLRSCAQILDDHYAVKNGYDFSYQGQTVSLTQLIKILAHEVDNKQLKKLEQNLAAFFDKHEPTSEWKELFDLVINHEEIFNQAENDDKLLIDFEHPLESETIPIPPDDPEDQEDPEEKSEKKLLMRVRKILENAKFTAKKRWAKLYEKEGGFKEAKDDFFALNPKEIKPLQNGEGMIGKLSDGQIVNVRASSSEGRPTLEIFNPINRNSIKIRYG